MLDTQQVTWQEHDRIVTADFFCTRRYLIYIEVPSTLPPPPAPPPALACKYGTVCGRLVVPPLKLQACAGACNLPAGTSHWAARRYCIPFEL